jgi:dolichyl-phosphate beta-glucosyltransferase
MKTISFVIPVYNEQKRIGKTFKALSRVRLPAGLKLSEVIFVNDGSTDQTKAKINRFRMKNKKIKNIRLISYPGNMGKGYAVRQGMIASDADYTLFFDADMSTPLSEISKLKPLIEKEADVIFGTRKNGKSTVIKHQPFYREFLGRGFTHMTKFALNLEVTDFTCGFKAFSKIANRKIFTNAVINGWGYDAEVAYLAKKNSFEILEKPVIWANDERTKVKLYKAVPQTLFDLLRIYFNHNIKRGISNVYVSPAS